MNNALILMDNLAKEFHLPIAGDNSRIWFFRTQSGLYYFDFYINQYIALGWNLISASFATDLSQGAATKKKLISELYPEEKRPGLIWGQMDTFYNKMQVGELVVIPSAGGQKIAVGILGDIISDVKHKYLEEDEYEKCEYTHKRAVKWLKQIDLWTDVYLSKVLRAQQTISDISEYSEMIYRNLYPCYISDDGIHITLQKSSSSEYKIRDSITLQSSVLKMHSALATYYDQPDQSDEIIIKTAVGSPGFIEIIFPHVPFGIITGVILYRAIVGSLKSKNGESASGIMAILTKGNELLNDHVARKKTIAETKQIEAETQKTFAETRKTIAEAKALEIKNAEGEKQHVISDITNCSDTIAAVTKNNGINFENQLDEVS